MPGAASRGTALEQRLQGIALMIFDVDGVLTDGRLHYGPQGEALKVFHVHDGHGLKMLRQAGIRTAILSGRSSPIVERRATELSIDRVLQGIEEKSPALDMLCADLGVPLAACGFMGDDWPDVPVLRRVGFAATVPGAALGVQEHAHWVSRHAGGQGAVREACELILRAQGKLAMPWQKEE